MSVLHLHLDLEPIGKGRPRVTKSGHAFTPAKTRAWTKDAVALIKAQLPPGHVTATAPLFVTMRLVHSRPKSRPKWVPLDVWKAGDQIPKATKPDVDNVAKAVMDALTKAGVMTDDAQIYYMSAFQVYAHDGGSPFVEVRLSEINWRAW